MVLIWTKEKGKRVDIILLPEEILEDFIVVHINRRLKLNETKTCLVTKDNDWNGIPKEGYIINLLKESLIKFRLIKGFDLTIPIPEHLFHNIKCRTYNMTANGLISGNDIYPGDFKMTLFKIEGRFKKTLEEIRRRPWIKLNNVEEIKKNFEKFTGKYKKEFVFLIEHIHPIKKRL